MDTSILMIKSTFLVFSLWAISIVMLWFRPRVEIFWKIIATIIFAFYVWFFHEDLLTGYEKFTAQWYTAVLAFFREILSILFVTLFIIWPVALILVFYKANEMGAEKLLKFMCIMTMILWIIFIIYYFFNEGIDNFLYDDLKKLIPKAK